MSADPPYPQMGPHTYTTRQPTSASPRGRHDAKITVYLTRDELLQLDASILEVRRRWNIKVDRSAYVREALSSSSLWKIVGRLTKDGET